MKTTQRSWCDIPIQLLESIVLNLSIVDVQRFKLVCYSWYNAAKIYPSGPYLMLSSPQPQGRKERRCINLLSIQHEKKVVHTAKSNLDKLLDNGHYFGCSQGWLFVLDKFSCLWLLNLFSGREIELPKRDVAPNILHDEIFDTSFDDFQDSSIQKAILTANPCYDRNYKVITIIYGLCEGLVFCNHGDIAWTVLSSCGSYGDVVWHDNMLYALLDYQGIEVWDLKDYVPLIKVSVWPPFPNNLDIGFQLGDAAFYLVPSMENLLVIKRYIRLFDEADGEPICTSRTVKFKIWKFDSIQETLSEVKSLGDQALFVGRNQTHLLSTKVKDYEGLKRDSVYFTTENLFREHDDGIFSLGNGSIEVLGDPVRTQPIPCWVLLL